MERLWLACKAAVMAVLCILASVAACIATCVALSGLLYGIFSLLAWSFELKGITGEQAIAATSTMICDLMVVALIALLILVAIWIYRDLREEQEEGGGTDGE